MLQIGQVWDGLRDARGMRSRAVVSFTKELSVGSLSFFFPAVKRPRKGRGVGLGLGG